MNDPSRRYQNLSRAELQRIEERFRRRRLARAGRAPEESRQGSRRQRRILWVSFGLAVIAVAVLTLLEEPEALPPPKPLGVLAPVLGARARLPMGAKEVKDARLAILDGLAAGSAEAQAAQLAASADGPFPLEVQNSAGIRLRLIPAGSFDMGSPTDQWGHQVDEQLHQESVAAPLYMSVYEITQRQWMTVMGEDSNPSTYQDDYSRPVENISWNQAIRFCKALAAREGMPEGVYRLPTEAEWEYACRAGSRTPFHFDGGAERLELYADFADNNYRQTAPVGGRRPNAYGLYDMHGNVWEWCMNTFYDYATEQPQEGFRALRGGNWRLAAVDCRSASRFRYDPTSKGSLLGFRIVRILTNSTLLEPAAASSGDSATPVPMPPPAPRDAGDTAPPPVDLTPAPVNLTPDAEYPDAP